MVRALLMCALVLGISVSGSLADQTLFQVSFNQSNYQANVVPPNGTAVPVVMDVDSSDPIAIEAPSFLLVPEWGDYLDYSLDSTYPDTTWFPANGRFTSFFLVTTPDNGNWINMFSFHYDYPGAENYALFSVLLGMGNYDGAGFGGWAEIFTWDQFYEGDFHAYNNGNVPGAPSVLPGNPMVTAGWHKLVVEWTFTGDIVTGGGAYHHKLGNINVYVDDQLGLSVPNADIGEVAAMDQLRIGTGFGGPYPIGYFSGLYGDVKIESTCPTGDISGPNGVPDCKVDFYDFAAMAANWLK
jgi:hypothetical protein